MNREIEYTNTHIIDDYIDNYFFMNCPRNYSISNVQDSVYQLFHTILQTGQDEAYNQHNNKHECELNNPKSQYGTRKE